MQSENFYFYTNSKNHESRFRAIVSCENIQIESLFHLSIPRLENSATCFRQKTNDIAATSSRTVPRQLCISTTGGAPWHLDDIKMKFVPSGEKILVSVFEKRAGRAFSLFPRNENRAKKSLDAVNGFRRRGEKWTTSDSRGGYRSTRLNLMYLSGRLIFLSKLRVEKNIRLCRLIFRKYFKKWNLKIVLSLLFQIIETEERFNLTLEFEIRNVIHASFYIK